MIGVHDLVGYRVRVDSGDGMVHYGILQGVRPDDGDVWMWDEATEGRLFVGPVLDIQDARHVCTRCLELVNRIFTDDRLEISDWCAACYRPRAQANQVSAVCEECGAAGAAYRSPVKEAADKRVMCMQCHARAGQPAFNRWAVEPPPLKPKLECAAASGTTRCLGAVVARGKAGWLLCNAHAGVRRTGERR